MTRAQQFNGRDDELQAALEPFVERDGPSFCACDESTTVKQAKMNKKLIMQQKSLTKALSDLWLPLMFSRPQLRRVLTALAKKYAKQWRLNPEEQADWKDTMCKRLTNLCGHTKLVSTRQKRAWFDVPNKAEDDEDETADGIDGEKVDGEQADPASEQNNSKQSGTGEGAIEQAEGPSLYFYGWDKQLKRAWRVLATDKNGPKDWSSSPRFSEGAQRQDPVEVSFEDGVIYKVPAFTVGQLLMSASRTTAHENLWEGCT